MDGGDADHFHLEGKTEFGDNIEDEWFIVFLLRHLTAHIDGVIMKHYQYLTCPV